jgi:high-affinity iron transporter
VLSTFIIALREGLEAALIVGILMAYLVKTNRTHLRTPLWFGVSLALVVSLGLGAILSFTSHQLGPHGEEIFAGTLALAAVALVTWMVFWMKRTARNMRHELENKVDHAVHVGSLAMALTIYLYKFWHRENFGGTLCRIGSGSCLCNWPWLLDLSSSNHIRSR